MKHLLQFQALLASSRNNRDNWHWEGKGHRGRECVIFPVSFQFEEAWAALVTSSRDVNLTVSF